MKRIAILIFAAIAMEATAQLLPPTDTIVGRCDRYYFSEWYDECELFGEYCDIYYEQPKIEYWSADVTNPAVLANTHRAHDRMAVKGVAVMVVKDLSDLYLRAEMPDSNTRQPEWIVMMQGNGRIDTNIVPEMWQHLFPLHMEAIDSVRWDTAAPLLWRLPLCIDSLSNDTTGWMECLVYEAYFPEPVMVDTLFYLLGTFRNSSRITINPDSPDCCIEVYTNYPTVYSLVREYMMDYYDSELCRLCKQNMHVYSGRYPVLEDFWHQIDFQNTYYGPFLPIVDFYTLNATSNDATMGHVEGTGRYPSQSTAILTAESLEGFTFVQWSDGSTDNPRNIVMTADTSLTAIFAANH